MKPRPWFCGLLLRDFSFSGLEIRLNETDIQHGKGPLVMITKALGWGLLSEVRIVVRQPDRKP